MRHTQVHVVKLTVLSWKVNVALLLLHVMLLKIMMYTHVWKGSFVRFLINPTR